MTAAPDLFDQFEAAVQHRDLLLQAGYTLADCLTLRYAEERRYEGLSTVLDRALQQGDIML